MRLLLTILLAIAATSSAQKKIICYYESWATYRNGEGKYSIEDIPAELCTHVVYSFVGIHDSGSMKLLDNAQDLTRFSQFVKSRGAKALISVGGASENPGKFSNVANDLGTRSTFVRSAVALLDEHGLDGLDVDWEYPNSGSGTHDYDRENFVRLLKELKDALAPKGYSLSAAVAADPDAVQTSYIVPKVSKILDFINVMTYDFNGAWNDYTAINAPLHPSPKDDSYQRTLNVVASIEAWLSAGAPAEKIIVGIPFYGRSFTLKDPNEHGIHAPTTGPGKAGPYTQEAGYIGYNELCVHFHTGTWTVVHAEKQGVPFMYHAHQWIGFDDGWSIGRKTHFINNRNLGGAMIWAIDTDDFRGVCGPKHPLLNAVRKGLN